ncbi:MAG: outer membrane lipoprotein carrier protein LolA, partial [Deltaproteobacteria bacterium]|nr:outer membrane lipoprotein carrier protein LolA [Deltaproteobacteria bacterium]
MRNFMYVVITLCGLLIFVSYAQAADPVAAAVQKRYAAITGMRADFTQILEHKESGSREERNGVMYFLKPFNIRW